jgi:arsenite methyltransferase
MSSRLSAASEPPPGWLDAVLGCALPREGGTAEIGGGRFVMRAGILRQEELGSAAQAQTASTFGYKWQRRETYDSGVMQAALGAWLRERYGDPDAMPWLAGLLPAPMMLDAGCGSGMSALELFGPRLARTRYLGVDISGAVDVARTRFAERGVPGKFLQCDLMHIPLAEASADIVFSEGVLHHTDSTEAAIAALARLIKPGGRFLFYVYRRKGPIREFTDDHIRDQLVAMTPEEAWNAVLPLTKLGRTLGELDIDIDIAEPIDVLQIPAGKINLQRLFYWHVFKAYYRPDLTLDEMNHINFDWYAPRNAHRQSIEEVRAWCAAAGLVIERERVEDAGITIDARKLGDARKVADARKAGR